MKTNITIANCKKVIKFHLPSYLSTPIQYNYLFCHNMVFAIIQSVNNFPSVRSNNNIILNIYLGS